MKSEVGGLKTEVSYSIKVYLMIKTVFDLEVFKPSYQMSMSVFNTSRNFSKEKRYSLTDQVVRSSRSIAANIAEGWGKRSYENEFKKHLVYAMGSLEETKIWLLFARDCGFLKQETYDDFNIKYDEPGAKIYKLFENWRSL